MKKPKDTIIFNEKIIQTSMEEVMHQSMIPYAEHIIMERALPRVEDGLKPVQRRILFTMYELSLTPDKPHRKCARIVGDCLGKYHPHGDTSVYEALVRMSQDFSMREPLVNGHGNFGSIDGDSAAAMRYTEARMNPLAMKMLEDIEKDTVDFSLNFDDALKEPNLLPSKYPNLLANGSSGIAIGLATNIPPHNLEELIQGVCALIDNPDISTIELMKYIKAPDFPTGGILLHTDELEKAYNTGKGKLLLRAKVDIEAGPAGRSLLVVTEIPYQVSKSNMLEKIQRLTEQKKAQFAFIHDIRDESDRNGIRAIIEIKKNYDPMEALALLYKYSDLQVTFGVNMVAIADGKPQLMGLKSILNYYIKHQENVITRRTKFDLNKAESRLHILEGLMIALDNLDEVIKIIRAASNPKEAREALINRFKLSEIQAQAILDMRLQRLTGLEIISLEKEYKMTEKKVKSLKSVLKSNSKLLEVIKSELTEIVKNNSSDRRTKLVNANDQIQAKTLVYDKIIEDTIVLYKNNGQLCRYSPKNLPKIQKGTIPEESEINKFSFETDTSAKLYILTTHGNCYTVSVDELNEIVKAKDRGTMLSGIIQDFDNEEQCVGMYCIKDNEDFNEDIIFVTQNGMIKRSSFSNYLINRSKFCAIKLKKEDKLVTVFTLEKNKDILLVSKNTMSIRFNCDEINATGRVTAGVKGMQLVADDCIIYAEHINKDDEIVLISDKGYAKRIPELYFETQRRSGKGVHCFYLNKNNMNGTALVATLKIDDDKKIIVYQKNSPATVISKDEIALQQKTGRGTPVVMAIMADTVTGLYCMEDDPNE